MALLLKISTLPTKINDLTGLIDLDALNLQASVHRAFDGLGDIALFEGLRAARHQPLILSGCFSIRARRLRMISLFWLAPLYEASLSSHVFTSLGKRTSSRSASSPLTISGLLSFGGQNSPAFKRISGAVG
ncbi:hypothetical protein ABIE49_002525 [Bradyrhizobium sp. OAE829]